MALGNDYLLTSTNFDASGNTFQNKYFFQVKAGSGSASDLAEVFIDEVSPTIAAICHTSMTAPLIQVQSRTNPEDFAEQSALDGGELTGNILPPFIVARLRWNTRSTSFRRAYKAFGRCAAAQLAVDGDDWISSYVTLCAAVGNVLEDLLEGGDGAYQYMVAKRTVVDNEIVWADAIEVGQWSNVTVSTQNTRKTGRGI